MAVKIFSIFQSFALCMFSIFSIVNTGVDFRKLNVAIFFFFFNITR